MKREIFNADGSLRAVIMSSGDREEIFDAYGSLLGVYRSATDETTDAYGSLVGRGNLLMTLI